MTKAIHVGSSWNFVSALLCIELQQHLDNPQNIPDIYQGQCDLFFANAAIF
jgi:hypothetical protein